MDRFGNELIHASGWAGQAIIQIGIGVAFRVIVYLLAAGHHSEQET